jgi:predicted nucleic acid-binding protein
MDRAVDDVSVQDHSYWDAAILAAAEALGAHPVYSEDLNAGQRMDVCES